jgi:hypothetical protein
LLLAGRPHRYQESLLVYDMYPWDKSANTPTQSTPADQATLAVQVALDRRDNGGREPDLAPRQ